MKYCTALFLMMFGLMTAQAELRMSSIFANGMVLQSGTAVPLWGEADSGSTVTVSFSGQEKETVVDADGKWSVRLDPLPMSADGKTLTVRSSAGGKDFTGVVVGEVWVLAGQSNMGRSVADCTGGKEAAATADYPWLRIFKQWPNQGVCDEPARDVKGGQWAVCTPEQAIQLSGIGFFFARALHPALPKNTPIAIINTQMGGTYAECWIPLNDIPPDSPLLKKQTKDIASGTYSTNFWGENYFRRPAALYNGKVAPLQPFAVRGVLWYQGEGDSAYWMVDRYTMTLTALINSWRRNWNQADLPFLVVQLPRYNAGAGNDWPTMRAAQAQVSHNMTGVELAVTIDCGDQNQIHPPDKEPVGERLALLAREKVYGQDVVSSSPAFQTSEIRDGSVFVKLTSADGLFFKGGEAKGFEICGADHQFVPAQAEILSDGQLRIFSTEVKLPVTARYGWFNWGEVSLFSKQGLPAAPFTTGTIQGDI